MIKRLNTRFVSIVAIFAILTLTLIMAQFMHQSALAASASGFNPGNIISDAVMGKYDSMSVADIQRFLTEKGNCNNTNYALYQQLMSQYKTTTWHFENGHFICLSEELFGDGTVIGEGQTAAEIIYQAAQDYKINPQVLIVLLEKEQSLITDSYPNSFNYRSATGYGCPDTAACDTKYYGFKNQVRNAAAMFRAVLDGGWSNYPAGRTSYIQYHPNADCGGTNVYIENRATSALYRYTPYQPNSAALSAGYGSGNTCSAYGNRNFYMLFTDWFGSTQLYNKGEVITIPDGEYILVSSLDNTKAIGIASGNSNGTNVQTVAYNQSDNRQKWRFEKDGQSNYYTITNVANNKALDLNGGVASNGENIQLWDKNSSCAQKWKIYDTEDHYLTLESACMAGSNLDLNGGSDMAHKVGANIAVWNTNDSNAQKWILKVGSTLEDGVYYISTKIQNSQGIEILGDFEYDGANVDLWSLHDGENQKWLLHYNINSDDYTITNPYTGKALDVYGGQAYNGANVGIWAKNNSCAQRWKIISRGNGNYNVISSCSMGYSLDASGGFAINGTNIQLWQSHSGDAQQWQFTKASPVLEDGLYNIVLSSRTSNNKQVALDVYGASTMNGANVGIWEVNDHGSEEWKIKYNASAGTYTIINPDSQKSLDVSGAFTANGTNIQIWDQNDSCAQNWVIAKAKDGTYQIATLCDTTKVLDVYDGNINYGTNVQIWTKNNTNAQKWTFSKR